MTPRLRASSWGGNDALCLLQGDGHTARAECWLLTAGDKMGSDHGAFEDMDTRITEQPLGKTLGPTQRQTSLFSFFKISELHGLLSLIGRKPALGVSRHRWSVSQMERRHVGAVQCFHCAFLSP